jgi:hypothetical protein
MNKGHSYFVLLEELKSPGCPICSLVIKDGRSYLDSLLYESVLDVPVRLNLMESFGFCNRHAWEIPKLPAICSPAAGFAIFASDLLRKFNLLVSARTRETRRRTLWRFLFRQVSQKLFSQMKARTCPACDHVAQFEAFHLTDLLDSITESEFFEAFNASPGICLPHLFVVEEKHANHPNFPLLLQLQLGKSQSLGERLEEFTRKQDRRFQQEITADEAKAWGVAMEFLVGKPGVFNNEIRTDPRPNNGEMLVEETVKKASRVDGVAVGDLITQIRAAKEVTVYQKQPLPTHLLEPLRDLMSAEMHPPVEIVVEDLSNVTYLSQLHASGFELFYGVGLPRQHLIFINSERGFVVEDNTEAGVKSLPSKDAEDLYYRLLWRRFGHAVSLTGVVKEQDPEQSLFCLELDADREAWCRLRAAGSRVVPDIGEKVTVFAWEKWVSHILDVIRLELLPGG